MKKVLIFIIFIVLSRLGYSEETSFLLSSEKLVQEKQGSLKGFHSFTFFPLLKMEQKNTTKIIDLIHQELKKVGSIIFKPMLTPDGADLGFANPTLQFIVEQLVDQNNNPLPILQSILCVSSIVELKTKELSPLRTNRWTIYLEKTNDIEKVVKNTLPQLLKQFIADFHQANPTNQKPSFYISYDDSWWNNSMQK